MKRKHLLAGASLSVAAVLCALAPSAAHAEAPTDDISEDFAAVAGSELLDQLPLTSSVGDELGVIDGGVVLRAAGDDAAAFIANDDDFGVLVSRLQEGSTADATAFAVTIPDGATAVVNETADVVSFFGADGSPLGTSEALWARDAEGSEVPTYFELKGETLTQVVDLPADSDLSYPIVTALAAAPNYYSSAWVTSQGSAYVVHAVPTAAGRRDSGAIFLATHTQQLKNKLGSNSGKVNGTIENQFHCHVVFNSFMGSGNTAYDMESWRPNVSYLVAWSSQCNPEP